MESLQKLFLPPQALERIKKLVGDLRLLCAKEVFKEAIEGNLNETIQCQFSISCSLELNRRGTCEMRSDISMQPLQSMFI